MQILFIMSVDNGTEFIELCVPISSTISFIYTEIWIYVSKVVSESAVFEYWQVINHKQSSIHVLLSLYLVPVFD